MTMLHTNEVLLRSSKAKTTLLSSGLFEVAAEAPPFSVLRLKSFENRFIDGSPRPWVMKSQQDWMQDSYAWFRSRKRLAAEWPVYPVDTAEIATPLPPAKRDARIEALSVERHRIAFRTSAPGQPHLIKVSYHPRWKLETQGKIFRAAPGFLMVVPAEAQVTLVYGTTAIGRAGEIGTAAALLFVLARMVRRRREAPAECGAPGALRWVMLMATMGVAGLWINVTSPNRIYFDGWKEMTAGNVAAASDHFMAAYRSRRFPAAREEALFWAAKAIEQAGDRHQAISRYRELFEHYAGYWVPESLYTYARLNREIGKTEDALPAERQLQEEYPFSPWTQRMRDEAAAK